MIFSFLWFAFGVAVGVNVALAGLWWSVRRGNRKAVRHARQQLDWMEEMERIEQEIFPDARPRSEVIVNIEPLASRRADQ